MQAVAPFLQHHLPRAIVSETIASSASETSLQSFCRLQIEQILAQLPDLGIRLVFYSPEHSKRHCSLYGREVWSDLDANAQELLLSESWWVKNSIARLIKVFAQSRYQVYACPISSIQPEYLLLGTSKLLTPKQKRLIENTAKLLSNYLSTVRELHSQRQIYQQLEQKNHQIEHQAKSPIALIQLYTELLLTTVSEQQSRSYLDAIQASIQDLNRHLNSLTVQPKPLCLARHDLSEMIAKSLKQLQPWLTEKQITVNYARSPLFVEVDAWQLQQVFDNLLSNAIHFSPQFGEIDCLWNASSQEILIELCDRGAGLSPTDLEHLFTPFYSRRPGGTGLGLAIAQTIIQAHQGRLWATNLPLGGTKFSISLPRHSPKLSIVPAR